MIQIMLVKKDTKGIRNTFDPGVDGTLDALKTFCEMEDKKNYYLLMPDNSIINHKKAQELKENLAPIYASRSEDQIDDYETDNDLLMGK